MIDKLLDGIASLCLRHSRAILLVAGLLAVLALGGATLLKFDSDILNLVPQNDRQVNEFRKVLRDMGTIDYHIVALQLPEGHEVGEYESLIDGIGEGYKQSPLIEDVTYKIPNPLDYLDLVLPKAFLFLTPAELDDVALKLSDQGIRDSVARNAALIQTPQSFAIKQLIRYDPFNLLPVFLKKFQSAGSGMKLDATSSYLLSNDHRMLIILTKPKRPAQDVVFGKKLLTQAKVIEDAAVAKFRAASPNTPLPTIVRTGGYSIAVSDADLIKQDAIANILFSFFGVMLLFIYGFRRAASIAYAGVPLALALGLTFGVSGIIYGQLSQISASFAALLAGLGIDFITVMYGRYVDERNRGTDLPTAIRTIMRATLPGIFVAAITTAGTFYAFLATDFRGMSQLGSLTGTGVLLFLLCVTFVLPALIIATERKATKKTPKLYLHSFGSEKLIDFSISRPRLVIISWIVFCLVCAGLATRIRFSDDIKDLRAKGNEGVKAQELITKTFGQSFDYMMFVVEGKTAEETLEKTFAASHDLDTLVKSHTIASYQSISTYLPPLVQQQAVIAKLQAGRNDAFNPERVRKTFATALAANGFRPEGYAHYLDLFSQTMQPDAPITIETLRGNDLMKLAGRFIKQTPTGWMSVTNVYPTGGRWGRDVPPALMAMAARHPEAVLTGVNLVSGTLRRIIRADATRATTLGFAAVFVLMLLSFRNVKMTALSFVPFVAGALGMLGLMALIGLTFNFMNIFVGLMIIGVATDYAVYMLQRYTENPETFQEGAHETGKAVVMAAVTAIAGYGSFAFSHYPGLRSIGYASFFGIGFSGLAAITLLPAILVRKRDRAAARTEALADSPGL